MKSVLARRINQRGLELPRAIGYGRGGDRCYGGVARFLNGKRSPRSATRAPHQPPEAAGSSPRTALSKPHAPHSRIITTHPITTHWSEVLLKLIQKVSDVLSQKLRRRII
ncbi:hypothetical protein K1T71_004020 [Dendrolimus kikuchii]|uniref:Uncharacterized protein n=1 Tax=Dendrolimus kikuchii TaxID=765133 RepID=A0ACC1DAE2_9NEOP|nr:hypothetical protein K1T71_004020 [Dendrolimus kikuchii]